MALPAWAGTKDFFNAPNCNHYLKNMARILENKPWDDQGLTEEMFTFSLCILIGLFAGVVEG